MRYRNEEKTMNVEKPRKFKSARLSCNGLVIFESLFYIKSLPTVISLCKMAIKNGRNKSSQQIFFHIKLKKINWLWNYLKILPFSGPMVTWHYQVRAESLSAIWSLYSSPKNILLIISISDLHFALIKTKCVCIPWKSDLL